MNEQRIRIDRFMLKARRMPVYRVRQPGSATILWMSADRALRYLKQIQIERLQAKSR